MTGPLLGINGEADLPIHDANQFITEVVMNGAHVVGRQATNRKQQSLKAFRLGCNELKADRDRRLRG